MKQTIIDEFVSDFKNTRQPTYLGSVAAFKKQVNDVIVMTEVMMGKPVSDTDKERLTEALTHAYHVMDVSTDQLVELAK